MVKNEKLNTNTPSNANLQVVANSGGIYRNKLLWREMVNLLVDVYSSGAQTARRRLSRAEVDVVSSYSGSAIYALTLTSQAAFRPQ